jgi:hypothetical protein
MLVALIVGCGCANFTIATASDGNADSPMGPVPQTVQHTSGFVSSDTTVDLPLSAPVMGNDLVIVATSTTISSTIQTPTDSLGSSYQPAASKMNPNPTQSQAAIYIATAPSTGSATVSCHIAGSNNLHCHVYVVRNVSSPAEATGTYLLNGTSLNVSTTAPTAATGDYVFAYFAADNSMPTVTAGSGFGDVELTVSPSNDVAFSEDRIASMPGIQTATATASGSDSYACLIVAIAP